MKTLRCTCECFVGNYDFVWNWNQTTVSVVLPVVVSIEVIELFHYYNTAGIWGWDYDVLFAFFHNTTFELEMNHIQTVC
jgi:hypothetical protein